MKTKSNQSKIDCLQSNHLRLGYSELDHSQLNHSMMVNASSIVLSGLMGITLLSGLVLTSSLTSADTDATDVVTITVPTSCSMSSTGTNSHTAELGNGQSNSTIGETTITTNCNDNEGFAIYAIGFTGDTLGNNKLTSTSLGSTHDIVTGTATSGNTSNWAMKLSTISSPAPNFPIIISGTTSDTLKQQGDPDYSTFQEVPDDYTKVAYRTSSTDVGTNAEGSVLKTTYQAYISPTQTAGTYQGKVKYVLVYPHNGDAPTKQTGVTCNPSGTTIGTGNSTDLVCMQDFASLSGESRTSVLTSMTTDAQYQLYDSRDEKQYYISKLADGNVWMTQNLDHDIGDIAGGTYTPNDTDISANWTPSNTTTTTTTWETYATGRTTPHSYDPGDLCWNGTLDTNYSTTLNNGTTACSNDKHYHIGNYYNWTAAVAMNDSSSYTTNQQDVNQSICPAGWRLPTYSGSKSYDTLVSTLSLTSGTSGNIQSSPVYFVYGGYWFGSSGIVGSDGYYWSSVVGDSGDACDLLFDVDWYLYPQNYTDRLYGKSVRCVAR